MTESADASMAAAEVARVVVAAYHGTDGTPGLRDVLAPDVVLQDWMKPGETVRGAEEFCRQWFEVVPRAFPDAAEEILATVLDGGQLVVHARFSATFVGDHYGIPAHGGPVSWEVIDRWVIEDGRIVRVQFMADTLEAHRQLHPGGVQ